MAACVCFPKRGGAASSPVGCLDDFRGLACEAKVAEIVHICLPRIAASLGVITCFPGPTIVGHMFMCPVCLHRRLPLSASFAFGRVSCVLDFAPTFTFLTQRLALPVFVPTSLLRFALERMQSCLCSFRDYLPGLPAGFHTFNDASSSSAATIRATSQQCDKNSAARGKQGFF